jgi:hypothetical protein
LRQHDRSLAEARLGAGEAVGGRSEDRYERMQRLIRLAALRNVVVS